MSPLIINRFSALVAAATVLVLIFSGRVGAWEGELAIGILGGVLFYVLWNSED